MGKTALGLGIATHIAKTTNKPVLVFSLEMGHHELTQRILSSEAEIDSMRLRKGGLESNDWSRLGKAIGRLEKVPLYLDDNPRVTVMEIRAKARRMQARSGGQIGLILIDYLQLMSGGSSAENRQLEVSEISRGLKILARELQAPIMALALVGMPISVLSTATIGRILEGVRELGAVDQKLFRHAAADHAGTADPVVLADADPGAVSRGDP